MINEEQVNQNWLMRPLLLMYCGGNVHVVAAGRCQVDVRWIQNVSIEFLICQAIFPHEIIMHDPLELDCRSTHFLDHKISDFL